VWEKIKEANMIPRTLTQSAETDVEPDAIFEILMDPGHIPQWAPAFAETVEPDAHHGWRVTKDGNTFALEVVSVQASRTVDYLREVAPGKRRGAYIRVLPRPDGGSVVVMTLPIPPGGNSESVAAILSQELSSLLSLRAT
jgi:uncharacterized protein YndB with AHSA1/START domain